MPFKRQFAFRRLAVLLIGWCGLSATLLAGSAQAEVRLRAPATRPPASGTVAFALTGAAKPYPGESVTLDGSGVSMACDSRRPTGNTYRDVRIHHNVFTGTRASALWLQDVPGGQARPRGNVARNNIVLRGADGATFDIGDPGRWSFSHAAFPDGLPGGLACRGGRQAGPGGRLGPVEHSAAGAAEHRRPRALRRRPPDYT